MLAESGVPPVPGEAMTPTTETMAQATVPLSAENRGGGLRVDGVEGDPFLDSGVVCT